MKRNLLILSLVFCFANFKSFSQTFNYNVTSSMGTYEYLTGGNTVNFTEDPDVGDAMDEGWANNIQIGFNFKYENAMKTKIDVSPNGFACFGNLTDESGDNNLTTGPAIPAQPQARGILAPLWDDHKVMGAVTYKTTGIAPNRVFTLEWKNVKWRYNASSPSMSFQLKLYETSNEISFVYKRETGNTGSGANASIGITATSTGVGNFYSIQNTAQGANILGSLSTLTTTENKSINLKPVTGQIYNFKPMNCHLASNLNVTDINFQNGTAQASWTNNGTGDNFEYLITQTASIPQSGMTSVTGNVLNLINLEASKLYYLHVRKSCDATSNSGWITKSFSTLENDEPCNAKVLLANTAISINNSVASVSPNEPGLNCSNPNNTVWFKYTATKNGKVGVLMTTPTTGNNLNGWVQFYKASGTCPNISLSELSTIECVGMFGQTTNDKDSINSPDLVLGETYYIMIDGHSNDVGTATIKIVPPQLPLNCANDFVPQNQNTNTPGLTTGVLLSWSDVVHAESYDVYFGTSLPLSNKVASVNASLFMMYGLNYNSTYFWSVVPKNSVGSLSNCISQNVHSFTTINYASNCLPLYANASTDKIEKLMLIGEASQIMNTGNMACTNWGNGYFDYTTNNIVTKPIYTAGQTYSMMLQTAHEKTNLSIWIDKNENGYYENNERILNNFISNGHDEFVSFTIPENITPGIKTLRIRNVRKNNGEVGPTDPCMMYSNGETEDYSIIVSNQVGYERTIAAVEIDNCKKVSSTMADEVIGNLYTAIPVLDNTNNNVATINPNGNKLGAITTSVFGTNTSALIRKSQNREYLSRNINIKFEQEPTANQPVTVTMYFTKDELKQLIAAGGDGVSDVKQLKDLGIIAIEGGCTDKIQSGNNEEFITPSEFGNIYDGHYITFNLSKSSSIFLASKSDVAYVNMVKFEAKRENVVNILNWESSFEYKTKYYAIERSVDGGKTFEQLNTLNAANFSDVTTKYEYKDLAPIIGINLYRIVLHNQENGKVISKIERVRNGEQLEITVFPNPAKEFIKVEIADANTTNGELVIVDISGKIIQKINVTLNAKTNSIIQLNTSGLQVGQYFIKGIFNGKTYSRRFTKIK